MRWDRLFDDLDAQWAGEEATEDAALAADELRYQEGRRSLADRLAAVAGEAAPIHVETRVGHRLSVHLARTGADWLIGRVEGATRDANTLVPLAALSSVQLSIEPADAASQPVSRVGIAALLRDLGRRGHPVRVVTGTGDRRGRIVRVGADHLDLVELDGDAARTQRGATLVPFDAIDHLRY